MDPKIIKLLCEAIVTSYVEDYEADCLVCVHCREIQEIGGKGQIYHEKFCPVTIAYDVLSQLESLGA